MSLPHETKPVLIWADVDLGIAEMVVYLNTLPGVRTHASCQGTIGEGGPHPYRPQVMATWPAVLEDRLKTEFDITFHGEHWGYLHPRADLDARPSSPAQEVNKGLLKALKDARDFVFYNPLISLREKALKIKQWNVAIALAERYHPAGKEE